VLLLLVLLLHSSHCIMQACGSSGTTAGLALGAKLAGLGAQVHAYGVCDSPEYFYAEIDGLLQQLGYTETGGRCV
jgi:1-aminocyclopropane-1-carboxylate deaminase/D-cysteine desulfhydrase-like pyridoxal-dependent ACC family enzyme